MKLYVSEGNPHGLKVLAAAGLWAQDVEVLRLQQDEKVVPFLSQAKLPALELNNGNYLFSANAICRYFSLAAGKDQDDLNNQWVEWEATELQPVISAALYAHLVQGKKKEETLATVAKQFGHISQSLAKKSYLSGDTLSVADIVVWGAIFPFISDGSTLSEDLSSLKNWFKKVSELDACQKAAESLLKGQGTSIFKAYLQKMPVPVTTSNASACNDLEAEDGTVQTFTEEDIVAATESWSKGLTDAPRPKPRQHPILPKDEEKNVLITSALPYVNNVPHLGNIIGSVLSADVFARYCRLRNWNTLYICGTDEYGTATETKAMEEGLTPRQICDKYNAVHTAIYKWFDISFDYFGRTTTEHQTTTGDNFIVRRGMTAETPINLENRVLVSPSS